MNTSAFRRWSRGHIVATACAASLAGCAGTGTATPTGTDAGAASTTDSGAASTSDSGSDAGSSAACDAGAPRWVTIGRYRNAECSGTPFIEQRLPAYYGSTCCHSTTTSQGHENSTSVFTCGAGTFTYTQWTSLTCSGGRVPTGTVKTYSLTGCTEDTPPGTWGRITDFSGCP